MRQTPVDDYLEEISTELPEELYGNLSDAIYETVCEFGREVDQLKADNASLRELVRDYDKMLELALADYRGFDAPLFDATHITLRMCMHELGIEVD